MEHLIEAAKMQRESGKHSKAGVRWLAACSPRLLKVATIAMIFLEATIIAAPLRNGDQAPRARDDFYRHVNASWLRRTTIPADSPWISPFVQNYRLIQRRIALVIAHAADHPRGADERRIGDLYASFLLAQADDDGRRALASLDQEFEALRSIGSADDVAAAMARFNRSHYAIVEDDYRGFSPLGLRVGADPDDAGRQIVTMRPTGLGLRDPAAYLSVEPAAATKRLDYRRHVVRMFTLAGDPAPAASAAQAMNVETALAQAQLNAAAVEPRRVDARELTSLAPGIGWRAFMLASGLAPDAMVLMTTPAYVSRLATLAGNEPGAWRNYFRWQLLRRYAPYLGRQFAREDFAFEGHAQLGASEMQTPSERGALLVRSAFPMSVARLYVARFGDPRARREVAAMTQAVIAAYRTSFAAADWLQPATRAEAVRKLNRLRVNVGWPDRWPDKPVTIRRDDVIENLIAVARYDYAASIRALQKPTDRARWILEPTSTSAYYDPALNQIAIPAGLMLWPWYRRGEGAAWNFGGIGTTIGHEVGHGFDEQGSRYDASGQRRDWWTPTDRARYDRRIDRLVAQYGAIQVGPGRKIDGRLTVNENLADLSGLTLAWRALHRVEARSGSAAQARDEQFFTSFVTHWRALYSDALLDRILKSDGHAPQSARANGPLRNFKPFAIRYGVRPGDGMYLRPSERVRIW